MNFKINCTPDGVVRYPMHAHKNYEIMLYLEGKGYMRTELGDVPFEDGTIVIVPPNIKHGSISKNGFKNISIEGDFEAYFRFDTVKSFEDNETQEGKMLAEIIYENRYGNDTYLASLCTAYVCFLMQRFELDSAMQRSVKKITDEISQNAFDTQIDLTLILSKSGYSEDYIRSCFKKITGKTPNEFLTEIRIKHACYLIDIYQDNLSLSEIAEKCGYLDYVYFSKKFKSVMGLSPREYRYQ
ncbi:MAG: helix-turn-helix transcriptional regulator [Ruminococcaceae bacterium]|nr:helix-turn-helix transcriptional regulator [Oscillospiraceae bacterium]